MPTTVVDDYFYYYHPEPTIDWRWIYIVIGTFFTILWVGALYVGNKKDKQQILDIVKLALKQNEEKAREEEEDEEDEDEAEAKKKEDEKTK